MKRKIATKSDLADIITSGGGTFSSNSNELLISSFVNGLNSNTIGGNITLTYSIESTDRSSYLSNECVLYEDIHFNKEQSSEPTYYIRVVPYHLTVTEDEWTYFTIESTYTDENGSVSFSDISFTNEKDWFTIERDENADVDYKLGYKVKATSSTDTQRSQTVYANNEGNSDWFEIIQNAPDVTYYNITYVAGTGVQGTDVVRQVEENTNYIPTIPVDFSLMEGYENMTCSISEEFTVTEDVTITISATKKPEPKEYEFIICDDSINFNTDTGELIEFGEELGTSINILISNKESDPAQHLTLKSLCIQGEDETYPDYTITNESDIPSWLSFGTINRTSLPYDESLMIKAGENNTGNERSFTIKLKQNDSDKECSITITQVDGNVVFLSNFDSMIINYAWEDTAGKDLDSATRIGYRPIDGDSSTYDDVVWENDPVGFNQKNKNPYLTYSGDNRTSGDEGVAIKFKDYVDHFTKSQKSNIESIVIEARANWYELIGTLPDVVMSYKCFKGGTIEQNGFTFSNPTGELIVEDNGTVIVAANGTSNSGSFQKWYTRVLIIEYSPITGSAVAKFGYDDVRECGWCGTIQCRFENITKGYISDWQTVDYSGYTTLGYYCNFKKQIGDLLSEVGDDVKIYWKMYSNNPDRIYNYDPTSYESTGSDYTLNTYYDDDEYYIYEASFTIKDYWTRDNRFEILGIAPGLCYAVVEYNYETEVDKSKLYVTGPAVSTPELTSHCMSIPRDLIVSDSPYGRTHAIPPTYTGKIEIYIESLDSSGQASPVTINSDTLTFEQLTDATTAYTYAYEMLVPEYDGDEKYQIYTFTVTNEAGKEKTYGIVRSSKFSISVYDYQSRPINIIDTRGYYMYSYNYQSQTDISYYILAYEDGELSYDNLEITADEDYDWITWTLNEEEKTIKFNLTENTGQDRVAIIKLKQTNDPTEKTYTLRIEQNKKS